MVDFGKYRKSGLPNVRYVRRTSSFIVQSVIAVASGNPTQFPCHTKKLSGNKERDHLCKHQSTSLHFPFIFDFPYLLHLIGDSIKQKMGQVTTKWIYYGLFMGLKLGFAKCISLSEILLIFNHDPEIRNQHISFVGICLFNISE